MNGIRRERERVIHSGNCTDILQLVAVERSHRNTTHTLEMWNKPRHSVCVEWVTHQDRPGGACNEVATIFLRENLERELPYKYKDSS